MLPLIFPHSSWFCDINFSSLKFLERKVFNLLIHESRMKLKILFDTRNICCRSWKSLHSLPIVRLEVWKRATLKAIRFLWHFLGLHFQSKENFIRHWTMKLKSTARGTQRIEINKFGKFWSSGWQTIAQFLPQKASIKYQSNVGRATHNCLLIEIQHIQNDCAKISKVSETPKIDRFSLATMKFWAIFYRERQGRDGPRHEDKATSGNCSQKCGIGNLSQRDELASNASFCCNFFYLTKFTQKNSFIPKNC